jgi:hypothetical protein
VKGTKDSNKAFLKAQVREGIGTMSTVYLSISAHIEQEH